MRADDRAALLRIVASVETINQMASFGVTVEQLRRITWDLKDVRMIEDGGWQISR